MRFEESPPAPLADAPGFLLTWNGRKIASRFAEGMATLGLHPRHFGVMRLIDAEPGITQHDLGARAVIDPSSMVAVLDELEQMGLAERRPHPSDRRKHAIHLTARGGDILAKAQAVAAETARDAFAPLSADELATLRRLLRKMAGFDD